MNGHNLSRREIIKLAGAGGIGIAAAGVVGDVSAAPQANATMSPEAFLSSAYRLRARAGSTGDARLLDQIYDPANRALVAFEKERAAFLHDGLPSAWDGTLFDFATDIEILELRRSGSIVTARLDEHLAATWIQNRHPVSPSLAAFYAAHPEKFASPVRGPRGEVVSTSHTPHEVALVLGPSGWRVAADAHDEFFLFGHSPDLLPGSWAAIRLGKQTGGPSAVAPSRRGSRVALARMLAGTYNYMGAVNYAHTYYSSYNGNYCNYNSCGGDCANFVSQCFYENGETTDGSWYNFSGACGTCGTTSSRAGTDTWANNKMLRDWAISAGRGVAKTGIAELGYGDIVNYDWTSDGTYDHVTIVSVPGTDTSTLVCSHNPNLSDYIWTLGNGGSHLFTWMNITF